ncbi:MAG: hypothetical protein SOI56_08165 [Eubacteriales bacterium]|jgi:hypothetical protein
MENRCAAEALADVASESLRAAHVKIRKGSNDADEGRCIAESFPKIVLSDDALPLVTGAAVQPC